MLDRGLGRDPFEFRQLVARERALPLGVMAGVGLPLRAIRTQIVSAIDLVVQIERMRDGIRRLQAITEVIGLEGDVITTQDLFLYQYDGENRDGTLRGHFAASRYRPRFLERIASFGLEQRFMEIFGLEG